MLRHLWDVLRYPRYARYGVIEILRKSLSFVTLEIAQGLQGFCLVKFNDFSKIFQVLNFFKYGFDLRFQCITCDFLHSFS